MFTLIDHLIAKYKWEEYIDKKYFNYVVYLSAILLGTYLNWSLLQIAALTFLFWLMFNPLPSTTLAKVAIILLFLTPVLIAAHRPQRAEQLATGTYLFLLLAGITALAEHRRRT